MSIEIIECEQNTPEWFTARMGLPTASEFSTVMARSRDGKGPGLTQKTYMRKLAGEIVTGEPMESHSNGHMERGKGMEQEARDFYAFLTDADLTRVGFIKNGRKGCSPDSLIGNNGAVEIKTALPHILIEHIEQNKFPADHVAQCQGILWVAEREWIDISIYWPKMPGFTKRAYRDDAYIRTLAAEVERFNAELDAMVAKIKAYGGKEAIAA